MISFEVRVSCSMYGNASSYVIVQQFQFNISSFWAGIRMTHIQLLLWSSHQDGAMSVGGCALLRRIRESNLLFAWMLCGIFELCKKRISHISNRFYICRGTCPFNWNDSMEKERRISWMVSFMYLSMSNWHISKLLQANVDFKQILIDATSVNISRSAVNMFFYHLYYGMDSYKRAYVIKPHLQNCLLGDTKAAMRTHTLTRCCCNDY